MRSKNRLTWTSQRDVRSGSVLAAVGLAASFLLPRPVAQGQPHPSPEALARTHRAVVQTDEPNPPQLWLTLSGCEPSPIENACAQIPSLLLQLEGADPTAYTLHVMLGDEKIACPAPTCMVDLLQTSPDGVEIAFWAESPSDTRKVINTAHLRVLPTGQGTDDVTPAWYVQVLSSQWRGGPVDSCGLFWDTFLPVGTLPSWLGTPPGPDGLASDVMHHYLAARLILVGAVDVSACTDGALTEDGVPSGCGAEQAMSVVEAWQNQFDEAILDAARGSLIPAALIKAVITQESQFWPGTTMERGEYGLGHLTEHGADNTLLWNKEFYNAYCPSILGETYCGTGYSHQSEYRKGLLRGSLLSRVDADCADCEWGVDLDRARAGIDVLAETLKAYCSQTGRMVSNVTREAPGRGSTFEDMWKLTLVSYAAGPGCVADALRAAWRKGELISWSSVSSEFTPECSAAVDYVNRVAR